MSLRSSKWAILLGGAFSIGQVDPVSAQEQFVGKEWGAIPVPGLESHSVRVLAYYHPDDTTKLILTPFYCMKADKYGKLLVDLDEAIPGEKNRKITVYMIISPNRYIEAISNYIQIQEQLKLPKGPFANIHPLDLITPSLKDLRVEDMSVKKIFDKVDQPGRVYQVEIPISAMLPDAVAAKFADDLRSGRVSVTFKVTATLNARKTQAEIRLHGSTVRAVDTDAYKRLVGNGGAFKYTVGGGGGSIEPAALTRDQMTQFVGAMKQEVQVRLHIVGEPKSLKRIDDLFTQFMKVAFPEQTIDKDFGKQLSRLYAYDFSPSDLKPDEIDDIISKMQKDFESEDRDTVNVKVDTKGGAFFGMFSGELNTDIKKDTLRKRMEKQGWNFESKGKYGVPRSMTIYVVDHQKMRAGGTFIGDVDEESIGTLTVDYRVYSSLRVDPGSAVVPEPWATVLDLKQRISVLEQQEASEATRLTTVANSSLQYAMTEAVYDINKFVQQKPNAVTVDVGTWGSRVIAAWWEPIDAIPAIMNLDRVTLSIVGNNKVQASLNKPMLV